MDVVSFVVDFSLLDAGWNLWNGCFSSSAWAVFWASLDMLLLIFRGAL